MITKRKDGRFTATVTANGRRAYVYGKTEKEVRDKLKELNRQVATTGYVPAPGKRTVDDLLEAFLSTAELKPKTIHGYRQTMKHITPAIGNLKLAKLEPMHLQKLYADLGGKSKRNALRAHLLLHRCCDLAVLWGWLSQNPANRVIKPTYRVERHQIWDQEQLATFLNGTSDHKFSPLWLVLVCCGLRLSEALALRWEDYDANTGTIKVEGNLQYVAGQWIRSTPKTQAGRRVITLPQDAIQALSTQRRLQAEAHLKAGSDWQQTGLVFHNAHGGPLQQTWVQNEMKTQCEQLQLPPTTPHGLRHLHASLLLSKGLPVTAVSARLGHASPSITMQVYAHALKSQDQEAAILIGDVLRAR